METMPRLSGEDADFKPISGDRCCIRGCNGTNESLKEALESVSDPKDRQTAAAKMKALLKALANGQQLRNPERWRKEGSLPGKATGHFFAVRYIKKSINFRAYVFLHDGNWWISHFLNKKSSNLAQKDTDRVHNNYRAICGNN